MTSWLLEFFEIIGGDLRREQEFIPKFPIALCFLCTIFGTDRPDDPLPSELNETGRNSSAQKIDAGLSARASVLEFPTVLRLAKGAHRVRQAGVSSCWRRAATGVVRGAVALLHAGSLARLRYGGRYSSEAQRDYASCYRWERGGGGLAQREGCGEGGCFDTTTESGRVPLGLERAAALRAYLDGERIRLMRSVEVPGGGALSPGKLPPLAVTAQLSDSFSQAAEGDGVTQSSSKMSETAAKYQVSPVRPLRARGTRSRSPRLSSLPPLARVASLPLCCHADGGIECVLIRWPLLSPALSSSLPAGRCVAGNITPREPFGSARPLQGHG